MAGALTAAGVSVLIAGCDLLSLPVGPPPGLPSPPGLGPEPDTAEVTLYAERAAGTDPLAVEIRHASGVTFAHRFDANGLASAVQSLPAGAYVVSVDGVRCGRPLTLAAGRHVTLQVDVFMDGTCAARLDGS